MDTLDKEWACLGCHKVIRFGDMIDYSYGIGCPHCRETTIRRSPDNVVLMKPNAHVDGGGT